MWKSNVLWLLGLPQPFRLQPLSQWCWSLNDFSYLSGHSTQPSAPTQQHLIINLQAVYSLDPLIRPATFSFLTRKSAFNNLLEIPCNIYEIKNWGQTVWNETSYNGGESYLKLDFRDFPGGTMVKNPPANAGGTRVRSLVREDLTCRRATKPMRHNYWACSLEPACHNYWSLRATTTEAHMPRARAPQQEKPPQWEAHAPQRRVAPAHHN